MRRNAQPDVTGCTVRSNAPAGITRRATPCSAGVCARQAGLALIAHSPARLAHMGLGARNAVPKP